MRAIKHRIKYGHWPEWSNWQPIPQPGKLSERRWCKSSGRPHDFHYREI